MKHRYSYWAAAIAVSFGIVGCGGGGGGGGPVTQSLSGAVATGAPLKNAVIYVKDVNGNEPIGQSEANGVPITTTDENGSYTLSDSVLSKLNSPLIVRAIGKSVSDSGDDIVVTLHSVATMSKTGGRLNVTQLTEAATTLALGQNTAVAFANAKNALTGVNDTTLANSNAKLIQALSLRSNNTLVGLDVFGSNLNTNQTATDTSDLGKAHDLLLDKYAAVSAQGSFMLVDRNRPDADPASAPSVAIKPGSDPAVSGSHDNSDSNKPDLEYITKLPDLVKRINDQLAKGCKIPFDGAAATSCDALLLSANKIFDSSFMDAGMTPDKYLRSWVVNAVDLEEISSLKVTVEAAFRGQWTGSDNKKYTRVFLRWTRADGDFVIRPAVLQVVNGDLLMVGNQKKYMVKIFPRLTYAPDSDGTYPYNPQYENSLNLIVKHWYAGTSNVIKGARISGPGLPTNRSTSVEAFLGEVGNRNQITEGVEIFDRRVSGGCSNMSVDPSVYVQKNTQSWNDAWTAYRTAGYSSTARATLYDGRTRWRAGMTNCNPGFDFMRYYRAGEAYTVPKNGDSYKVVLFIDPARVTDGTVSSSELDDTTVRTLQNDDGDNINVYFKTVNINLTGDAFPVGTTLTAETRPGIADEVRLMLKNLLPNTDRLIKWTRNSFIFAEADAQGKEVKTAFFNYTAGSYISAYDQWRPTDSYYGTSTSPFKKYNALFTRNDTTDETDQHTLKNYCGRTVTYADDDVTVYVQKATRSVGTSGTWSSWQLMACGDLPAVNTLVACDVTGANKSNTFVVSPQNCGNNANGALTRYNFFAQRTRHRYSFDAFTLTTMLQKERTLTWDRMRLKEPVNNKNLCSSHYGYWGYRQAYVGMLDINGRMIQERREVWADFPGSYEITNTDFALPGDKNFNGSNVPQPETPEMFRGKDVSRPNMTTDAVFFPMNPKVDDYLAIGNSPLSNQSLDIGSRGLISQSLAIDGAGACSPVARP